MLEITMYSYKKCVPLAFWGALLIETHESEAECPLRTLVISLFQWSMLCQVCLDWRSRTTHHSQLITVKSLRDNSPWIPHGITQRDKCYLPLFLQHYFHWVGCGKSSHSIGLEHAICSTAFENYCTKQSELVFKMARRLLRLHRFFF